MCNNNNINEIVYRLAAPSEWNGINRQTDEPSSIVIIMWLDETQETRRKQTVSSEKNKNVAASLVAQRDNGRGESRAGWQSRKHRGTYN